MNEILLKSKSLIIVKVLKKTTAEFFKDLKTGSTISLSIPVGNSKYSAGRLYANYIKVTNLDTGEHALKSFCQIETFLNMFNLVEV